VSQENVELVRSNHDALWRREWGDFRATLLPDVIYRPIAAFPENEECRGAEALQTFMERFFEPFADDFTREITSVRDYGDAVSMRIAFMGHARASGVKISGVMFQVIWCRDGRIVRIEDFATSAEALRAIGIQD
jgi:ketosteroid isomerase-like protein